MSTALLQEMDRTAVLEVGMLCAILVVLVYAHYAATTQRATPWGCAYLLLGVGSLGQVWLWSDEVRPLPNALVLALVVGVVAAVLRLMGIWTSHEGALFAGVALAFPASIYGIHDFTSVNDPLWALLLNLLVLEFGRAVVRGLRKGFGLAEGMGWPALGDSAMRAVSACGAVLAGGRLALGRPLSLLEAIVAALALTLLSGPIWSRWRKGGILIGVGALAFAAAQAEAALVGLVVAIVAGGYTVYRLVEGLGSPGPEGWPSTRPFAAVLSLSVAMTAIGGGSLARIVQRILT